MKKVEFEKKVLKEAMTFDDVLLVPQYSEVLPSEVDTSVSLTSNIKLNIPVMSSPMDTVTESHLAIALAQEGGLGIIHKNMSIQRQQEEVEKVKRFESGMIVDPITLPPDQTVSEAIRIMKAYSISGIPITKNKKLVGILTNRDLRFVRDVDCAIETIMTRENLITAAEGTTFEQAKEILQKHRIEKLPVVDESNNLIGLITYKDINKHILHPKSNKDHIGRLRVGAAVSVGEEAEVRAESLVSAKVDVLVIDTAHGHSLRVLNTLRNLKRKYADLAIIAGNVVTAEGTKALIKEGADAVKVGIGPGSICTTRIVSGVGVPQITAIMDCAQEAQKAGIPIIADGGIRYSGDITKAIAAGAHVTMIGSLFAGTDESPGEVILYQGRSYKVYRGMGSLSAMRDGSRDRYGQENVTQSDKLVPEGIEGRVPYRGSLEASVHQLMGGLKSGMGYCGVKTIEELRHNARFIKISFMSSKESHVHNVIITKEAPNYRLDDL
ncbi:IMP dehydrogenase [bacterium]|nr:IMP dehydrogenase [bacterium]